MPNRLPIPPELALLIEKRDDADRRRTSRRSKKLTVDSAFAIVEVPEALRPRRAKSGPKSPPVRRSAVERRQLKRRRSDKPKSNS